MTAFLIVRLPSHLKSLDAVEYMQKNAFSYRISTSIPLMNFLMTSEGGDSRQLEVFEELELGKEEVRIIANMTCIFPPQIKAEVDSTGTSPSNENSAPLERIVKEEVDTSTVGGPDDRYPRLEMSSVTTESVEIRENPSVDAGQAEEEVVDEHQEQPEEEMNSFLNQVENDDVIMSDNVLLADDHEFDESNSEMAMNMAVSEEGVHDFPTVLEEVQRGAEEHEKPHFLDEKEAEDGEQRVERGEGHEMTVDELLEPLDAGDSTMALRPFHNNDVLFDFEDSSRLDDELQLEKEIIDPEDGDEENMDVDRNVEEFEEEEEEELVEEQEHEDGNMDAKEIEEKSDEGIDDEEDMEEDEEGSDEEKVSDDEDAMSEESAEEQTAPRKAKVCRGTENSIGRHLFSCFVKNCSSSFKTFKTLEDHVKVHSEKHEFSCDVCKKEYSSKAAAMRHIQERKKKECCACEKKFSHSCYMTQHFRSHTGEKPYVCKTCGKGFSTSYSLKKHMITHTGEKRFSCSYCNRRFALKCALEIHERTHTGYKPFKCSHCDYRCGDPSNLRSHIRTHTGEKPYACGHCKKRFSLTKYLKNHELTHTGEKPYACGHCKKQFSQACDLKKHELTHTGEKPFECKDCGKRFSQSGNLNRHIPTHSGQKPYSCKKCDAKFTQSNSLKYHMERKHK